MSQFRWPSSPPILTDGSLRLRAWGPKDADAVFAACQDPSIQRWTRVPVPYEPQHAVGFVGELAASQWAAGTGAPFAVAAAGDDEIVGACGLVAVKTQDLVAEVGYWVAPWARGQHVAQNATRLLADWAFTDVGFERLELYIEPANTASCTVAEKLGCEREGVLRSKALMRNQRRDMALYALVNDRPPSAAVDIMTGSSGAGAKDRRCRLGGGSAYRPYISSALRVVLLLIDRVRKLTSDPKL